MTSFPHRDITGRGSTQWIVRFTATERLLHWSNALAFLVLAFTGFSLHIHVFQHAWTAVLAPLPLLLGQPITLIDVHIVIALFFVAGPVVWTLAGNRTALRADAQDMLHFDADDRAWLARVAEGGTGTAPQGRFNAGQKLNALATVVAFGGFIITGIVITLWPTSAIGSASPVHAPYLLWHWALVLHMGLALASVAFLAGHVYLAALNPTTRHSLHGMVFGRVRRAWAWEHHAKWVASVEEQEHDSALSR